MKIGTILSNFDIIDICHRLAIPLVGIYSKDRLITNKRGFLVINLGDFDTGGTHWVIASTYEKKICYFDPYGQVPPVAVDRYIKRSTNKKRYTINKIQIQSINSTYCGWYCIAFLYYLTHSKGGIKKILDKFTDYFNSDDLNDNYDKLLRFFNNIFSH